MVEQMWQAYLRISSVARTKVELMKPAGMTRADTSTSPRPISWRQSRWTSAAAREGWSADHLWRGFLPPKWAAGRASCGRQVHPVRGWPRMLAEEATIVARGKRTLLAPIERGRDLGL